MRGVLWEGFFLSVRKQELTCLIGVHIPTETQMWNLLTPAVKQHQFLNLIYTTVFTSPNTVKMGPTYSDFTPSPFHSNTTRYIITTEILLSF